MQAKNFCYFEFSKLGSNLHLCLSHCLSFYNIFNMYPCCCFFWFTFLIAENNFFAQISFEKKLGCKQVILIFIRTFLLHLVKLVKGYGFPYTLPESKINSKHVWNIAVSVLWSKSLSLIRHWVYSVYSGTLQSQVIASVEYSLLKRLEQFQYNDFLLGQGLKMVPTWARWFHAA